MTGIEITEEDFNTIHHELGHTYYQLAYRHQPPLFRDSANDGFHEAIGDTIALSVTPEYLVRIGLLDTARHEIAYHAGGQGPMLHFHASRQEATLAAATTTRLPSNVFLELASRGQADARLFWRSVAFAKAPHCRTKPRPSCFPHA